MICVFELVRAYSTLYFLNTRTGSEVDAWVNLGLWFGFVTEIVLYIFYFVVRASYLRWYVSVSDSMCLQCRAVKDEANCDIICLFLASC
jgi:hypothetical protein